MVATAYFWHPVVAPHGAGVVALMLEANPNLTVEEIGTTLTETAVAV